MSLRLSKAPIVMLVFPASRARSIGLCGADSAGEDRNALARVFVEEEKAGLKDISQWPVALDVAEHTRRSVYLYVKRSFRMPLFEAFDMPDTSFSCERRNVTTVAPQAFSLAALSYVSIEHVSGCCAPQTPTHALKSAARLSRVVLPELSRRPPTLDIVAICTIDRRVAKPLCAAVIARLSWRPGNSSRRLHSPLAVRHDSPAPSSRQARFAS